MKKLRINVPYRIIAAFGSDPCGDNGKEEVIYYCPQCINRKGTADRKGKLYVNTKSYKFQCFRCGYKGRINENLELSSSRIYDEDKDQDLSETLEEINTVLDGENLFKLKIPIDNIFTSDNATKYLLKRGFTEEQLEYYDLRVGNLDQDFGRIIIPNQVKKLVFTDFYSARTFIDQTPKYLNPGKEKSKIVFNLFRQKPEEPLIIVEGALTAIAAGYHAVATLGKTITKDQAGQIAALHPSVVYLNYDYGAESFAETACKLLKSYLPQTPVYNVLMKDERDAADLSREEYIACLNNAQEYNIYDDISELFSLNSES